MPHLGIVLKIVYDSLHSAVAFATCNLRKLRDFWDYCWNYSKLRGLEVPLSA